MAYGLRQTLTALIHACALVLAGFLLMGSLALIGAHRAEARISPPAPLEAGLPRGR